MNEILRNAKVARLAMADGDAPYIVPMNFGVEFAEFPTLYFHCAKEGRKLDILAKNPRVCVCVDGGHRLIEDKEACKFSFAYESVIGDGVAEIVSDRERKVHALDLIMRHQAGIAGFAFSPESVDAVCVIEVRVTGMTGKRSMG